MKIAKNVWAFSLLALAACTGKSDKKEIWIYASSYKEVLALYEPELAKAFPELQVKFFQAGSEVVATKVQAELAAGKPKADLIMTSDLFFFQDLANQGHLMELPAESFRDVPEKFRDENRRFTISRFPVMVLAYNTSFPEKDRPKSFKDLTLPRFKGKLTMPSPLESGTALTAVTFLREKFGDDYFKKLRENDMLSSGGNGAVMARVQSGERPVAILLMENVLQAHEKGMKQVEFVLPEEGGIPMPSPLAVMKASANPAEAKRVFEWLLGDEAQNVLIRGWVYSSRPNQATPAGAPDWAHLKLMDWSMAETRKWGEKRQEIKDFFQKTVLN